MTNKTLSQFLVIDAATCAGMFAIGVLATAGLTALTGLPDSVVSAAGWICLAAGALLAWLAARPSYGLLRLAIAGNTAWVVASLAVWAVHAGSLTASGHALVIGQAIGVAVFGGIELRGAAMLRSRPALA